MEIEELHIVEVVAIYLAVHNDSRSWRTGLDDISSDEVCSDERGFASQVITLRGSPARRFR